MFVYEPVKLMSFTHLSPEDRHEILREGAIVAEKYCTSGLLQYVRPDGSVFAQERMIGGERRLTKQSSWTYQRPAP